MKVPEGIKKCVAFVGLQMADSTFRLLGTVFFVGRDDAPNMHTYAVTAKHIIEGTKSKGLDRIFIRFNLKDGDSTWLAAPINNWIYHENLNVDIALLPIGFDKNFDHLFYPLFGAMTASVIKQNEIDVGDEVFITGLFKHYYGIQSNIPIVRVGNISAMPGEQIQTRKHLMDAYLIEARSIGGISGSPVFVNLGIHRKINGKIMEVVGSGGVYFLMGLIYGHFDSKINELDSSLTETEDKKEYENINTGIAIVTPIDKLLEVFGQKSLVEHEEKQDRLFQENSNKK